jgi:hypothetical protein
MLTSSASCKRTDSIQGEETLRTNHFPKDPPPDIFPLGFRISTYEFEGNPNIHTIKEPAVHSSRCWKYKTEDLRE